MDDAITEKICKHALWLVQDSDGERADLRWADLRWADLSGARLPDFQLPDGELVVYKKLFGGTICTLRIPAEARRTASLVGNKCRAEYAVVIYGGGYSYHTTEFRYLPGETVRPDYYDDDPRIECSHGIHFFRTRKEAEEYRN